MKVGMISLLSGVDEGKTFLLKNLSVFEGGRSPGNHVVLKDPSVAMCHFRICRSGDEYVLYDQGTRTGTTVNGETFEKWVLCDGDVIRAGDVEMRFDLVDENTPGRIASCAPDLEEVAAPKAAEQDASTGPGAAESAAALVEDLEDPAAGTVVETIPGNGAGATAGGAAGAAAGGGSGGGSVLLEIVEGEERGRVYELTGRDEFTIGRSTMVDLRLRDSKVSRMHCCITRVGDHFVVFDNHSSNGTVVNGEKVKKTVLKDGDFVRLGFTILRFIDNQHVGV